MMSLGKKKQNRMGAVNISHPHPKTAYCALWGKQTKRLIKWLMKNSWEEKNKVCAGREENHNCPSDAEEELFSLKNDPAAGTANQLWAMHLLVWHRLRVAESPRLHFFCLFFFFYCFFHFSWFCDSDWIPGVHIFHPGVLSAHLCCHGGHGLTWKKSQRRPFHHGHEEKNLSRRSRINMRHVSILVLNRRAPSAAVRVPLNPPCHRMNYSSPPDAGNSPSVVSKSK